MNVGILITGVEQTPRWETVQQMLREATGDPEGLLVRISRDDGGADYRAPGVYRLEFRTRTIAWELVQVVMEIES